MTDDLVDTLRAIVERLGELGIPYMIVGSVAALAHGRSRTTRDFDMVVEVDAARVRALVASLPPERFYVDEQAALDALRSESLFNVIDLRTGWKVDLVPRKKREFSQTEFGRRRSLTLFGMTVFVSSLEDTIVSKLEWAKLSGGSARQIEDVAELVKLAGTELDQSYVEQWVACLGLKAEWSAAKNAP